MGTQKADEIRAAKGLELFNQETDKVELDTAGATAFKDEHDKKIAALELEVKGLTGKDNKKARTEKSKEVSNMKNEPQYIDACKVVKGLEPKNGFFAKKIAAAKPAGGYAKQEVPEAPPPEEEKKDEKKDKPKKAAASTGISKDERDELEKLKKQIVERKSALKAEGMSGGQQNKDPEVATMVARMNELKEKESPGSTGKPSKGDEKKKKKGALGSEEQALYEKCKVDMEEYRQRLVSEFGYGKKDIKVDPEMMEYEQKIADYVKRGA